MTWGISIRPEDHSFLARVQIFRVLQIVLDEARADATAGEHSNPSAGIQAQYGEQMLTRARQRLVQLALRIVHFLAAQVAFSKDQASVAAFASVRLTRMLSGPETLSQALFDMLYAELHTALKEVVLQTSSSRDALPALHETGTGPSAPANTDDATAFFLDAEQYAYRIVRLLYSVVVSAVCQKYVSAPKWLSLLFAAVGYGGLGLQRRLLRLLRRLLVGISPQQIRAYVHAFLCDSREIFQSNMLVDEDALNALHKRTAIASGEATTTAGQVIDMFLDAIGCTFPAENIKAQHEALMPRCQSQPAVSTLCAESLTILRMLMEAPQWRSLVNEHCSRIITRVTSVAQVLDVEESKDDVPDLREILRRGAAVLAVCGGYIDVLRLGGTVSIRPFSLGSAGSDFAHQFASVAQQLASAHTFGTLVACDTAKRTVEIVLVERGRTRTKSNAITQLGVSGQPIRGIKMSVDDVFPAPDFILSTDSVDNSLTECVFGMLDKYAAKWIERYAMPRAHSAEADTLI
jgi:hypothetical protein